MPLPRPVTLLTWNIRQGGRDADAIVSAILALCPDVAVLTEHRPGRDGGALARALVARGFYTLDSGAGALANGVLIAARTPITRGPLSAPDGIQERFLHALVDDVPVEIAGAYMPLRYSGPGLQRAMWDWLLATTREHASRPIALLGDFNTCVPGADCPGSRLPCCDDLRHLTNSGWRDVFAVQHPEAVAPSWWHGRTRSGFRLDYAFMGPAVDAQCVDARYVMTTGEHLLARGVGPLPDGRAALSDHAALVVRLA